MRWTKTVSDKTKCFSGANMRLKGMAFAAGSGEGDFEEFYDWWTSDKESSVIKKSQGDQKDFEIEPH